MNGHFRLLLLVNIEIVKIMEVQEEALLNLIK